MPAEIHGIIARSSAADLLDGMLLAGLAQRFESRATAAALGDPLLGELPGPDVVEDRRISACRLVVDDRRPAGEVAVLGGVGDRVAHAADALLVHEVDDELQLVEALEVGRLGLVAGVDERLEAGLHQGGEPAAQHDLLTEEVGLGLLVERGLEHAGPGAADGVGVGQGELAGLAGGVLGDGDEARHAAPSM